MQHLFELGKSKTRIRKEKKAISRLKKLLLTGYAERCEHHVSTAKRLCYIFWAYAAGMLVCVALWAISTIAPGAEKVFSVCVLAKVIILDIPVNTYSFIMTKHSRSPGGITWRWTEED